MERTVLIDKEKFHVLPPPLLIILGDQKTNNGTNDNGFEASKKITERTERTDRSVNGHLISVTLTVFLP